jgi:hypothetical protein
MDPSSSGQIDFGPLKRIPRQEKRNAIYVDDIPGAKSNNPYKSTLNQSKHDGSYQRQTNPLDPEYNYPGMSNVDTKHRDILSRNMQSRSQPNLSY